MMGENRGIIRLRSMLFLLARNPSWWSQQGNSPLCLYLATVTLLDAESGRTPHNADMELVPCRQPVKEGQRRLRG